GEESRVLTVFVDTTPPLDSVPPILAPPVGAVVINQGTAGTLFLSIGRTRALTLQLLPEPAAIDTPVQVSSADPLVASIGPSDFTLPAGGQHAAFTISTGNNDAKTLITLQVGSEVSFLLVVVGTPPDVRLPVIIAPSVRVEVIE
ncbi:hypothetical protein IH992_16890, partial [Candidatus Poribacteria bacterium]|nr:hypothetical protein [Candidatus Poribacteria bacterium]